MTRRAGGASLILSAILIAGGLTGCAANGNGVQAANGNGVQIDYPSDSYDKQVEMCVDLVAEVVDWVGRAGVRAVVPDRGRTIYLANGVSREFAGTIESGGDSDGYDWTCEVRQLDGLKLQATLTALESNEAP